MPIFWKLSAIAANSLLRLTQSSITQLTPVNPYLYKLLEKLNV